MNYRVEEKKSRKIWIVLAVIFLIVIAFSIIAALIFQPQKVPPNQNLSTLSLPKITTSGKITALNQAAGPTVTIASVTLSQPGYVVVHEENKKSPEKVIGRSDLLAIGTLTNLTITLERPAKTGEILFAIVHNDDGNSYFDYPGLDLPAQDPSGKTVIAQFKVE